MIPFLIALVVVLPDCHLPCLRVRVFFVFVNYSVLSVKICVFFN